MKTKLFFLLTFATLLYLSGCKGVSSSSDTMPIDSVATVKIEVSDTVNFPLNSGARCNILAKASISYPNKYKDAEATKKLQKLFASTILESGDSISFQEALKSYPNIILNQYGPATDGLDSHVATDYIEDEDEGVTDDNYSSSVNINVVYNKNDIITFCKEEITKKNGELAMKTHTYYNIDLKTMTLIDLSSVFKDTSFNDLTSLLKSKLLTQNNAKNEDELNDLGYYNLDNLNVNNNFYFTDEEVVWVYAPLEVAVALVGEPKISLPFDVLEPFEVDGSVLKRF